MEQINKVKSISIWIFIVPFVAVNTCLILITQFQELFPNQEDIIHNTIPYFDGGASISRTARPYPSWLVFKPAMFLTSFLLIKYWLFNKAVVSSFEKNHKYINKFVYFGIASAIALTVHSIFLGIKFDNDFYKLFIRLNLFFTLIFAITSKIYFVNNLRKINKNYLKNLNNSLIKTKIFITSFIIILAIVIIPTLPFINFKNLKYIIEWNYYILIFTFYLSTFFLFKKN